MIIFSNYDTENYREAAIENLNCNENDNPTEEEIYEEINFLVQDDFLNAYGEIKRFFDKTNNNILCLGTIERWNGKQTGANFFEDFDHAWNWMTKDCDYYEISDEKGHLYIKCSHHDGTNIFELRQGSEKLHLYCDCAVKSLKSYAKLPYFSKKVYGC